MKRKSTTDHGATRLASVFVALSFVSGGGCGHTHSVASPSTGAGADTTFDQGHATPPHDRAASPAHQPASVEGAPPDHQAPPKDEIGLASSPAALLKPGALDQVQQRLVRARVLTATEATGTLDKATQAALVRFQKKHDLPATGALDDKTVEKLGLKPGEIFKTSHD